MTNSNYIKLVSLLDFIITGKVANGGEKKRENDS